MKACFTGHRNVKSTAQNINAINKLIDYALENGVTEFYSGMADRQSLRVATVLIYYQHQY